MILVSITVVWCTPISWVNSDWDATGARHINISRSNLKRIIESKGVCEANKRSKKVVSRVYVGMQKPNEEDEDML